MRACKPDQPLVVIRQMYTVLVCRALTTSALSLAAWASTTRRWLHSLVRDHLMLAGSGSSRTCRVSHQTCRALTVTV
jgi:hypothetical protein